MKESVPLTVLILAAGKGTRMVSDRAKVLHRIGGKSMVRMVYDAASELHPDATWVVIGYDAGSVRAALHGLEVAFVTQSDPRGTGHAVMACRDLLADRPGDLLILTGDAPRVTAGTLAKLVDEHRRTGADTSLLTMELGEPYGYGRILRDRDGRIDAIIEERDATPEQRRIREVNPGFYCFRIPPLLQALDGLSDQNDQKEYYLTDLISIQRRQGRTISAVLHQDAAELRGVNTRGELAEIAAEMRRLKNRQLLASGVTLVDPERTYIDADVRVGKDAVIHPLVTLEGTTRIGERTIIRPGTRIVNSTIGKDAEILDHCLISESEIGDGSTVGPHAHVRNLARIGSHCRIGNFVEVKKSTVGDGSKAAHLSYLGDAIVGRNVNIGAGTITCNYDGVKKNVTIIEDDVFIGSDSQLIAPVKIGEGAYVAAGSTIVSDVPAGALGIARGRQAVKENWARRRREPGPSEPK